MNIANLGIHLNISIKNLMFILMLLLKLVIIFNKDDKNINF